MSTVLAHDDSELAGIVQGNRRHRSGERPTRQEKASETSTRFHFATPASGLAVPAGQYLGARSSRDRRAWSRTGRI